LVLFSRQARQFADENSAFLDSIPKTVRVMAVLLAGCCHAMNLTRLFMSSTGSPEDYLLARQGRNLQRCVARSFSGWEGPLVLFQRERTKQTLDPYYECQEEHDADYQQRQEQIELLNSFGFCIRGIHDYLLVPVIKFVPTVVVYFYFCLGG
jgi:hypothetical protein